MENLTTAKTVETPTTIEPIVSPSTPDVSNQEVANLREKTDWRGYVRPALFGALAVVGAAGAYKAAQSSGHNVHHGEAAASEHDPQTEEKNTMHNENNHLRLDYLKGRAMDALTQLTFANGNKETLRKCLKALEEWRDAEIAANGQPTFDKKFSLVSDQTPEEAMKENAWQRMESAIKILHGELDEPELTRTDVDDMNQ